MNDIRSGHNTFPLNFVTYSWCRVVLEYLDIENSKLACDTGGHFTNYPTWPLPRTNPNVDVLNN